MNSTFTLFDLRSKTVHQKDDPDSSNDVADVHGFDAAKQRSLDSSPLSTMLS